MARKPRYHVPGAFYHVMLRGNDGQKIFFCNADKCRLSLLLQDGIEKYGYRIHAFCFMGNHIHLLVQVGNISLSKLMHNLSFRYSQFINRRNKKIGHLFQGRFKAILVQEEAYFLRLLRYIHMNPIRAYLAKEPEEYEWSSHRTYLGDAEFVWLTTSYGLSKFDDNLDSARLKYQNYILKKETEDGLKELRQGFIDGQVLGDDHFLDSIRNFHKETVPVIISLEILLKALYQVYKIDQVVLASHQRTSRLSIIRGAAGLLATENGISFEEIAKVLKRDGSSLGRLVRNFSERRKHCIDLQKEYRQFEEVALHSLHSAVMQA